MVQLSYIFIYMKKSKINTITSDALQDIIDTSDSFKHVLARLGMNQYGGGNMRTLHSRIKRDGINLSKLNANRSKLFSNCAYSTTKNTKLPLTDILINQSTYMNTTNLRNRLISENILKYQCILCGQLPEHNGMKLSLQLDHINGIRNDNRIENLRILCPNCHTQTPTYGRKNGRTYKQQSICTNCGVPVSNKSKTLLCKRCRPHKRITSISYPPVTKDALINDIMNLPMIQIGNKYGVSDNAVRKWLRKYQLPTSKSEITTLRSKR